MAGSGLATAHSTRPVLPTSPRFARGARARARPYDHGRTLLSLGSTHSRLFLFHSAFVDFYIHLLSNVTLGSNIAGPAGAREEGADPGAAGDGGEDAGHAAGRASVG